MPAIRSTALICALTALAAPAFAEVDGTDPAAMVAVMQSEGYPATLSTDSTGDPMITSKMEGIEYSIFFYGCTDGQACSSIKFSTAFNLQDGMTLQAVNRWHKENRFGTVHLDDEMDPFIDMDVNVAFGVSDANFADTVDWWRVVLSGFKDFIDW
ncbi:MAG: YbjN domain-containing protein [Paracoccaceae bacterium]|nr:YbjN domain-containing protein [Paracoccaceae bacterium]